MIQSLRYISDWSPLLPLIFGAVFFKSLRSDSKLIMITIAAGTISQSIHFFLQHSKAENFAYNLYTPIEFSVYYFVFLSKIKSRLNRIIYKITFMLDISITLALFIKISITYRFINELVSINNFLYILWIILYLYEVFKNDTGELTKSKFFLWYLVGILMYACCTSVFFLFWQRILHNSHSTLNNLWAVQNVFNILLYTLLAIGLLIDKNFKVLKFELTSNAATNQ